MGYTIDIDTGGTFTDGYFADGNRAEWVKVPTTPHDLTVCFADCIRAGAERFGLPVEDLLYEADIVRFSNTIGTNTIIERDGTKLGLLVTTGREGLAPTAPGEAKRPLVWPEMVIGVAEETSEAGEVARAVDEKEALVAAQTLIDRGARALVVAFVNSDLNPANERAVQAAVKREYPRDYLGSVPVFLSSNTSPLPGAAERINAAVINAYIHAKLVRLLYKAGEDLRRSQYRRSLFIGHNDGAVSRIAKTRAINTYNSGPAGGLLGARLIGRLYGAESLISADMGGTSFDVGWVREGRPSASLRPSVEGFPVSLPMLSIRAIGAGGGSIASVAEGRVRVGPRSAGALPGPACFGLGGTEPTVTDADVVLGILDPGYFLGGGMRLDREKAAAALESGVAAPLGIGVEAAALLVKRAVDETMGREAGAVKAELGDGPAPLLVVYGGAGPAHCCDLARVAGLPRIVITPFSAVFSAFGGSTMDVGHVYHRRVEADLAEGLELAPLRRAVESMEEEARRDLRGEGFSLDGLEVGLEVFVRPDDAAQERLPADPEFGRSRAGTDRTVAAVRRSLGAAGAVRLKAVALRIRAPAPHNALPPPPAGAGASSPAPKSWRRVVLDEAGAQELPVFDLGALRTGQGLSGPALAESPTTTLFLQRGWTLRADEHRNYVLVS